VCSLFHCLRFDFDYLNFVPLGELGLFELIHPINLVVQTVSTNQIFLALILLFYPIKGLGEIINTPVLLEILLFRVLGGSRLLFWRGVVLV
jgi:hypothetical protein